MIIIIKTTTGTYPNYNSTALLPPTQNVHEETTTTTTTTAIILFSILQRHKTILFCIKKKTMRNLNLATPHRANDSSRKGSGHFSSESGGLRPPPPPPAFSSTSSFSSPTAPRKWQSTRNTMSNLSVPKSTPSSSSGSGGNNNHRVDNTISNEYLTGDETAPRMQLFEGRASIEYLPEEDDMAALVYGVDRRTSPVKRSSSSSTPRQQPKEGVSGYNFHDLLKH